MPFRFLALSNFLCRGTVLSCLHARNDPSCRILNSFCLLMCDCVMQEQAVLRQQVGSLTASLRVAEQAQSSAEVAVQEERRRSAEATQVNMQATCVVPGPCPSPFPPLRPPLHPCCCICPCTPAPPMPLQARGQCLPGYDAIRIDQPF